MITLGLAIYDIGRSTYGVYHATDRQQKQQNVETLILGTLKATVAASICLSLYTARFVIKNPKIQYALAGVTFCVHPLATLDAIGVTCCIDGLFHKISALILQTKIREELDRLIRVAEEQVRAEGFKFPTFWEKLLWNKGEPPETSRRMREVIKTIRANYDSTQVNAWGVECSP